MTQTFLGYTQRDPGTQSPLLDDVFDHVRSAVVVDVNRYAGGTLDAKVLAALAAVAPGGVLTRPVTMDLTRCQGPLVWASDAIDLGISNYDRTAITWEWPTATVRYAASCTVMAHHAHRTRGTYFKQADAAGARVTGNHFFKLQALNAYTIACTNGSAAAVVSNASGLEVDTPIAVRAHKPRGGRDTTTVTGAHASGAASLLVADTSRFQAAGVLYVNAGTPFLISYTGKDATHFTGCTWGAYGTVASALAGAEVLDRAVYETYYLTAVAGTAVTLDRTFEGLTMAGVPFYQGAHDIDFEGKATLDGNMDPAVDDAANPFPLYGLFPRHVRISEGFTFRNGDHGGVQLVGAQDCLVRGRGVDNGRAGLTLGAHFWLFQNAKRNRVAVSLERGFRGVQCDDRTSTSLEFDNACDDNLLEVHHAVGSQYALTIEGGQNRNVGVVHHARQVVLAVAELVETGQWGTAPIPAFNTLEVRSHDQAFGAVSTVTSSGLAAGGSNRIIARTPGMLLSGMQAGMNVEGPIGRFNMAPAVTVTPDRRSGDHLVVALANGAANTQIANPTGSPWIGARLAVTIRNLTGGAYAAAFTWGAGFVFAGGAAPAVPASTKESTVWFEFDGGFWKEQSRTAADVG
jgi:hypothetical protein